jgi:hypothetical protein
MEKRIPFVKFGRKQKSIVMFNPQRVKEWIEENSHEPRSGQKKEERPKKINRSGKNNLERFKTFAANL